MPVSSAADRLDTLRLRRRWLGPKEGNRDWGIAFWSGDICNWLRDHPHHMLVYRFIACVGLGGGWQIIFQLGGAVSLLVTVALMFFLPESLSYLAAKKAGPDVPRGGHSIRSTRSTKAKPGSPLVELFTERRSIMTPLLWLVYVANSITLFALVSWLPVLVEAAGLARGVAALALSCFFLGGAAGGLVVGYLIDRSGMKALVGSALIACPVVGSLGALDTSGPLLPAAATAAGFFTIGVQNSLHGVAGSIYPTPIGANGMGWALGFGKIGSIAGPFIGGLLLSIALPVSQLFGWMKSHQIALCGTAWNYHVSTRIQLCGVRPSFVREPATRTKPDWEDPK